MIKKVVSSSLGVAVAVTLLVAVFGGDLLWSYWQGVQGFARDSLRDATSIRFDLKRLHEAIDDLNPVLLKNRQTAAKLDVEIEFLQDDTEKIESDQRLARAEMLEIRNVMRCGHASMVIDGRQHDRKTVEADLSRRLEAYSLKEKQLAARKKLLAERQQTLSKVVAFIQENEHQQKLLADQANSLDAELQLLQVAQSTNDLDFDQPAIEKTRQLKTEIQKRLETLRRMCRHDKLGSSVDVNLNRRNVATRFDQKFFK